VPDISAGGSIIGLVTWWTQAAVRHNGQLINMKIRNDVKCEIR